MNENKTKNHEVNLTHEEIGQKLGVSRAYVSHLEKTALEKMKEALKYRYNIQSSDDLL